MRKVILVIAIITSLSLSAMADPFSNAWEWDNPKLAGKVKTVRKNYKSGAFRVTTYTPTGQRIQTEYTDPLGAKRILAKFIYDDQGNFTEYHVFKPDGTINYKEICTYKSKGIKDSLERIRDNGKEPEKATFEYDEKGHRSAINILSTSGNVFMTFTSVFDNDGRLIETGLKETARGLRAVMKVDYNGKGFKKTSSRNKPGEPPLAIERYEYEYDEAGNWISKKTSSFTIKEGVETLANEKTEKREIEYY